MDAPERVTRILKLSFVGFGFLLIYLVINIPVQPQRSASPAFELAITIVALTSVIVGFSAPRFPGRIMKRTSQSRPGSTPLNRWVTGNLVSVSCFNACNLFGLVLHFAGGRARFVETVLVIGMVSLLFWNPGTPPSAEKEKLD